MNDMMDTLKRIETMLVALLRADIFELHWVIGWSFGRTPKGDPFVLLYPPPPLKRKVCRVYKEAFHKLPEFIDTASIPETGCYDDNPEREKAISRGHYKKCPRLISVLIRHRPRKEGEPERRFHAVVHGTAKKAKPTPPVPIPPQAIRPVIDKPAGTNGGRDKRKRIRARVDPQRERLARLLDRMHLHNVADTTAHDLALSACVFIIGADIHQLNDMGPLDVAKCIEVLERIAALAKTPRRIRLFIEDCLERGAPITNQREVVTAFESWEPEPTVGMDQMRTLRRAAKDRGFRQSGQRALLASLGHRTWSDVFEREYPDVINKMMAEGAASKWNRRGANAG